MDDVIVVSDTTQQSQNRNYYVYSHDNLNPERGDLGCRYIGKGFGDRAWVWGRNCLWSQVFTENNKPHIEMMAEGLDEETALEIEKWLIAVARAAGVKLCNITDGGDGVSGYRFSEEAKKKMSESAKEACARKVVKARRSAALKAMWADPEKRAKRLESSRKEETKKLRSEASKRMNNDPAYKKKQSDAVRKALQNEKVKEKRRKTDGTDETKKRRSAASKEVWSRSGTKEKWLASITKTINDKAFKKKICETMKVALNKPETREKMSASAKARCAREKQESEQKKGDSEESPEKQAKRLES